MVERLSRMTAADRAKVLQRNFQRSRDHSNKWRREAREDFAFYSGDQWEDDDRAKLTEALRPVITYNRVMPILDSVIGAEVQNRQEVRYIPREQGDIPVSEMFTGASQWVRDLCDAEDEETDAFMDTLICGMGWTETRIDYDDDPDGQILIERIDPIEMYWDTGSKKPNLADAKEMYRIRPIDQYEFAAQWPKWAAILPSGSGYWDEGYTDDQGEIHFNDEIGYQGDQMDAGFDRDKKVYWLTEAQWYEHESFYRTINPQTGQMERISESAAEKLRPRLEALGIPLVQQKQRQYYRSFMVGWYEIEFTQLPVNSGFTYTCITGKRERNRRYWTGLVKQLKDPQKWANKLYSSAMHILAANAKGGLIAEESAFSDREEAETMWAAADSIVYARDGALGQYPKIQPKPQGQYPQALPHLLELSLSAFKEVSGVNMEMLGLADRDQPNVLEYQRKKAGLTILAVLFNSLRRYRKMQGRVQLEFIQRYISDGRLVRILGQDGSPQYIPLVRQPGTPKYDIIVDEAPTSPNQKEMVFQVMQMMLPILVKMGIPVPPDILDYSPLPTGLVQKWKQMLQQPQGEKEDPDAIKARSQAQLDQARAQTEQAKAQEHMAKGQAALQAAQAQQARIAELTPVDAAQREKELQEAELERQRGLTEQQRRSDMARESGAQVALLDEKRQTEEARQRALQRRPAGE